MRVRRRCASADSSTDGFEEADAERGNAFEEAADQTSNDSVLEFADEHAVLVVAVLARLVDLIVLGGAHVSLATSRTVGGRD